MVGDSVPYEEQVTHPAFDQAITNSGILYVSQSGVPVRRQLKPVVEVLEIGTDLIVVERASKITEYPIPDRLSVFLSVLRSVILATPEAIDASYQRQYTTTRNGWTVTLRAPSGRRGTIMLSGCGPELKSIGIETGNGQQRLMKFLGK